jgi:dienelactone hydrolase
MAGTPWTYRHGKLALGGEIFRPQDYGNGKAVLVVHEADGIGGNVRRHCQMLAELGYIAAAADMHGQGRPLVGDEIPAALAAFKANPDLLRDRIRAAYDALKVKFGLPDRSIAAVGYCFGGTAVLELARSGAPLAAAASFHGLLTTSAPAEPNSIKARVLVCTGARDPLVPLSDVVAFQAEMAAAQADWQLAVFGTARHSFTNSAVDELGDDRMAFDPLAEEASWSMLQVFLDQSLHAPLPRRP